MPQRRNEIQAMVRQEPYAYAASFNADNQVEYEAWAEVGAPFTEAKWIVCKHTYSSGNLVRTQWAKDSANRCGDFTNIIGNDNVTPGLLSSLTYV